MFCPYNCLDFLFPEYILYDLFSLNTCSFYRSLIIMKLDSCGQQLRTYPGKPRVLMLRHHFAFGCPVYIFRTIDETKDLSFDFHVFVVQLDLPAHLIAIFPGVQGVQPDSFFAAVVGNPFLYIEL